MASLVIQRMIFPARQRLLYLHEYVVLISSAQK